MGDTHAIYLGSHLKGKQKKSLLLIMSKFALLSLPLRIFDDNDTISAIASTVGHDNASVLSFDIPEFKIGTLDALVQQADQLVKLEATCKAVVSKVADSLATVCAGDKQKLEQNKLINNSM